MGKTVGKDVLLLREMAKDPAHWVSLSFLASYPKLQALVPYGDVATLSAAVSGSQTLELSAAGTEVRRNQAMPPLTVPLSAGEPRAAAMTSTSSSDVERRASSSH